MNESAIRTTVRKLIKEILDESEELEEISTTSGAGHYSTPHAFRGRSSKAKKDIKKKSVQGTGWLHTDDGKKEIEKDGLNESRSKYTKFKNDQSRTAKKKIYDEVRELRKLTTEVNRRLKIVRKYKNEFNYDARQYRKKTNEDIYKMEELILRIAEQLREISS
ncbi:MAG: hypothetical protein VW683_00480 [Betaproteobacteria bacterium]|jgi:hypothetical protein